MTQPAAIPSECQSAVIGGGIVGMCAAWFLAEAGHDVVCVDLGAHAGSTANAGSLHVQMQSRFIRMYPGLAPAVERALPLYPRAVRHWESLAQRLGEPIELKVSGGLMVAETQEHYAFLADKCRREERLGLKVEMLDRAAVARMAPYLGPAIIGAEFCADEGKLNPLLANAAIRRRALAAGVRIASETQVERLTRDGAAFKVTTRRGSLRAGRIVLAAGAGSGRLAADLGVHAPTEAEPLHMNITEPTAPHIAHLVQHADRPITLKQLAAGHVVIGGGWPADLAGEARHPTVRLSSLIGNISLAQHVAPAIGSLRLLRTWAGINTTTDGRPVLGEAGGAPGLFFAIPGDAGYTLGPLCARLAADLVLDRACEIDVADYSPDRFRAPIPAAT